MGRSAMVEKKANFALDLESTMFTAEQVNAFLAAYASGYFMDKGYDNYAVEDACVTFVGAPDVYPAQTSGTGTFCGKDKILAGLSKFDKTDEVKIVGTKSHGGRVGVQRVQQWTGYDADDGRGDFGA